MKKSPYGARHFYRMISIHFWTTMDTAILDRH